MEAVTEVSPIAGDSGLESLTLLLRFHGIAADDAQIRHRFGAARIGITEMLRCAREFKLKARGIASDWRHLSKLPLPAIVERSDGTFVILVKVWRIKHLFSHRPVSAFQRL